MTTEPQDEPRTTRRGVLLGVGLAGLGGVLAGCSTQAVPYDANENGQLPSDQSSPSASMMGTTSADGGMGTSGPGTSAGEMTAGKVLGEAKEVPVGGGIVYTAARVVVTQPTKGKYHAFSAVCTHVGCIVNKVAAGTIDCPCHGSTFRVTDGAVVTGPADSPLAKKKIKVEGGKVVLL